MSLKYEPASETLHISVKQLFSNYDSSDSLDTEPPVFKDRHLFSSGGVVVTNTRSHRNLLHCWIMLVIVKQRLVQIGRIDEPTEYLS